MYLTTNGFNHNKSSFPKHVTVLGSQCSQVGQNCCMVFSTNDNFMLICNYATTLSSLQVPMNCNICISASH